MNRYLFSGTDMEVRYYAEKIHGCCGATMISGASFAFKQHVPDSKKLEWTKNGVIPPMRVKFYQEWWEKQLSRASNNDLNRSMIVFIDAVNGEQQGRWPCLYEFGKVIGFEQSLPIINSRSGNAIVTFTGKKPITEDFEVPTIS